MTDLHATPDDDAEALQIGRYHSSQKYEVHSDTDLVNEVTRPATLIVYLSDLTGPNAITKTGSRFPRPQKQHSTTLQTLPVARPSSHDTGQAVVCPLRTVARLAISAVDP